jgi:uncharacterized membrane protein
MTLQQFRLAKAVLALVLGGFIAVSVFSQNYIFTIVAAVIAVPALIFIRKSVKDVVEDERDFQASGTAARAAIAIFCLLACILAFALLFNRNLNPNFEIVGVVLAYSTCSLLIFYSLFFKYFESGVPRGNKAFYTVAAIALFLVLFLAGARFFSGEDDWICRDGQWVKHGQPAAPMPTTPCK